MPLRKEYRITLGVRMMGASPIIPIIVIRPYRLHVDRISLPTCELVKPHIIMQEQAPKKGVRRQGDGGRDARRKRWVGF